MTLEQAEETIAKAIDDDGSRITATLGRKLVYWGIENRAQVALYDAVGSVFSKHWGPTHLGLKQGVGGDELVVSALTSKSKGDWMMPDLVAFAHPRRKRTTTSPREIHCFEIEQRNGFTIKSVYQAFEQARGANYAWLFAHSDSVDVRIADVAREQGVGVVIFGNPNSSATYSHPKARTKIAAILAKRRDVSSDERAKFLSRVGLVDVG